MTTEEAYRRGLNQKMTVRNAILLMNLTDSLKKGVDTRCYIAKLAEELANNLENNMPMVSRPTSQGRREAGPSSTRFADEISRESVGGYEENKIQAIADGCQIKK